MSQLLRSAASLALLVAVIYVFGSGFAGRRQTVFIDAGLIRESYRVHAAAGLSARLRNETVIVAAKSSEHRAYMGAGVILGTQNGYVRILTARHIVRHQGRKFVIFPDRFMMEAGRIVISRSHDMAVVFVREPPLQKYPAARLAQSGFRNGQPFVVMGHPGAYSWLASPGVVQQRSSTTLLFCPTCDRGDSGAGAFDDRGVLHGIVVTKAIITAPSAVSWKPAQLIAFQIEQPGDIRAFLRSVK